MTCLISMVQAHAAKVRKRVVCVGVVKVWFPLSVRGRALEADFVSVGANASVMPSVVCKQVAGRGEGVFFTLSRKVCRQRLRICRCNSIA